MSTDGVVYGSMSGWKLGEIWKCRKVDMATLSLASGNNHKNKIVLVC